jgi:TPR repeat protein
MKKLSKIASIFVSALFLIALGACLSGGVTPQDSFLANKKGKAIIESAERGDTDSQYKYAMALLDTGGYFDLDFSINEALVARTDGTFVGSLGMKANDYRTSHRGLLFEEAMDLLQKAITKQHPLAAYKRHQHLFKLCIRINESDDREALLAALNQTTKNKIVLAQDDCMASAHFMKSYLYKHCPVNGDEFSNLFHYFQKYQEIQSADVLFLYRAKQLCNYTVDDVFWFYYERVKYENSTQTSEQFKLRTLAYGFLMQRLAAGTPDEQVIKNVTASRPVSPALLKKVQDYAAQIEKNYALADINLQPKTK